MVEPCEFAVVLMRCEIVGEGGIFLAVEKAEEFCFAINTNLGNPAVFFNSMLWLRVFP